MQKSEQKISNEHLENLHINNKRMFKELQKPCADCNIVWHPLVMTFDHVDRSQKYKSPSALRTYSPAVFEAELAKCDVVCRNCHQIREYLRDLNIQEINDKNVPRYKYYHKLIPYLCGGAMLRRDAYDFVPIGNV